MIKEGRVKKNRPAASGKGKGKAVAKNKIPPPPKKQNPTKDSDYFHCGKVGHWRRNCPSYHAELRKGKAGDASNSGIFHIQLYAFSRNS